MRFRLLLAVALAASSSLGAAASAHADGVEKATPTVPEVDAIEKRFFTPLAAGRTNEALDYAFSLSPLYATKADLKLQISTQYDTVIKVYGVADRWERVSAEALGTFTRRETILVHHKEYVTRWRLIFINTTHGWVIADIRFDDQSPTWFD